MIEYESKNNSFKLEKAICFEKPELWKNEALILFSSAKILLEFSNFQMYSDKDLHSLSYSVFSDDVIDNCYWRYRTIRMLWGFGFENILKGIIIKDIKNSEPSINEIPLKEIKTHYLLNLFKKAKFNLDEEQQFYIDLVEKCSVWMGRYPLPIYAEQMYNKKKSAKSPRELIENAEEIYVKWQKGEIPRITSESEILHGLISNKELLVIESLLTTTLTKFDGK